MENKYISVYVKDENNEEIITPDYVYLTIPTEWICVYHKLLIIVSNLGKEIIDDCNTICKSNNKLVINCWNIFQSAVACRELGDNEKAEFFINYIIKQLDVIYKTNNEEYNGTFPITITPDGLLKAVVSCGEDTKFKVDDETGDLYRQYLEKTKDNKIYIIEDNNLKVIKS